MTLPTGQFWCWRGVEDFVQMGTNEPFVGCSFPNIGSLRKHGFSHTFGDGSVPEPGEALLLDALQVDVPCNCERCVEKRGGFAPRHARIVTRKPLEDKP